MSSGRQRRRDSRERVKSTAPRARRNLGGIINATGGRGGWGIALAILCVAAWLPIHNMTLPLQYDETYTLDNFAVQSVHTIVTDYRLPNNHIALSLILNGWWKLNGRPDQVHFGEAMWRIPVVTLSILGYLAFFLFVLRGIVPDAVAAALSTLAFASTPTAVEYAHQLRGYGPCVSYFCVLLAALAFVRELHWAAFALIGLLATFLATYTIPTSIWFLVPAIAGAGIYLLLVNDENESAGPGGSRWIWIRRGVVSPPFALQFLPVALGPVAAVIAFSFATIDQGNLSRSIGQSLKFLASDFIRFWKFTLNCTSPTGRWLPALTLATVAGVLLIHCARRDRHSLKLAWLLLPVVIISSTIAGAMTDRAFERNFSGAIPWFIALDVWLLVSLASAFGARKPARVISTARRALLATFAILAFTFGLMKSHELRAYFAPHEIFAYLKQNMGPHSLGAYDMDSDSYGLYFYGRSYGLFPRFNYFESVPQHLPQGVESVFLLSSSDDSLKQMLKRFGLESQKATSAFHDEGKFGRSKMYRVDFGSAR